MVQFAGTAAQTTFVSSSQLDAITPSRVAIGPTELKVQNKSGAFHSRSDLFRFYASRIDFGPLPVNPAGSTNEVSDLVISSLVPKIPTAAASLVASFRNDDNLRLIWTIPAQPIAHCLLPIASLPASLFRIRCSVWSWGARRGRRWRGRGRRGGSGRRRA